MQGFPKNDQTLDTKTEPQKCLKANYPPPPLKQPTKNNKTHTDTHCQGLPQVVYRGMSRGMGIHRFPARGRWKALVRLGLLLWLAWSWTNHNVDPIVSSTNQLIKFGVVSNSGGKVVGIRPLLEGTPPYEETGVD